MDPRGEKYAVAEGRDASRVQRPTAIIPLVFMPRPILPFERPIAGRKKRRRPHRARPLGWSWQRRRALPAFGGGSAMAVAGSAMTAVASAPKELASGDPSCHGGPRTIRDSMATLAAGGPPLSPGPAARAVGRPGQHGPLVAGKDRPADRKRADSPRAWDRPRVGGCDRYGLRAQPPKSSRPVLAPRPRGGIRLPGKGRPEGAASGPRRGRCTAGRRAPARSRGYPTKWRFPARAATHRRP